MGITNLKTLIKACAIPRTIKHYKNKKGAMDTSIFLYRYIYRSPTEEDTVRYVIDGFLQQLDKFRRNNIVPIYILDGAATQFKKVIEERKKQREKTAEKIVTFEEEIVEFEKTLQEMDDEGVMIVVGTDSESDSQQEVPPQQEPSEPVGNVEVVGEFVVDVPSPKTARIKEVQRRELHTKIEERRESVQKLQKQNRKPTGEHVQNVKKLFDILEVPYIHSPVESDALFAYLMKNKKIDFVFSEDTDMLPLGCSSFVCGFDNPKINMAEYYLHDVLTTLDIEYKQFVDLCILCGCDYTTGKIEQIGPKRGLGLIKKHKTIEKIIEEYINSSEKLQEKHPFPEDFMEQVADARNMFYTSHNFDDYIVNNQDFLEKFEGFEWKGTLQENKDEEFCDLLEECGMDQIAQSKWLKTFTWSPEELGDARKSNKDTLDKNQKTLLSFFSVVQKQ
jgi:5'-3' exonuclease